MQPTRAFLVRCWPEKGVAPDQPPTWRFSIEEVRAERRVRGFASLEALMAFLQAELTMCTDGPAQVDNPSTTRDE